MKEKHDSLLLPIFACFLICVVACIYMLVQVQTMKHQVEYYTIDAQMLTDRIDTTAVANQFLVKYLGFEAYGRLMDAEAEFCPTEMDKGEFTYSCYVNESLTFRTTLYNTTLNINTSNLTLGVGVYRTETNSTSNFTCMVDFVNGRLDVRTCYIDITDIDGALYETTE